MKCVITTAGRVLGEQENNTWCFYGIPYGKARRFLAPAPTAWKGELKCFAPKTDCIRSADSCPVNGLPASEDSLHLNIFTPDFEGKRPVLIDLHGGDFTDGSCYDPAVSPVKVSEENDAVYVSINFRLGALGWLYFGDDLGEDYDMAGNNGLLDVLFALEWLSKNIEKFGGDPNRLILAGNAAGADMIAALMATPSSVGVFDQALLSGGAGASIRSAEEAKHIAEEFLKETGAASFDELLTMDVQNILKAQEALAERLGRENLFGPVADDILIAADWMEQIRDEDGWYGSVMIGGCDGESEKNKQASNDLAQALSDRGETVWVYRLDSAQSGDDWKLLRLSDDRSEALSEQGGLLCAWQKNFLHSDSPISGNNDGEILEGGSDGCSLRNAVC